MRKALWEPQARRFIKERFGSECVGITYDLVYQTPTILLFRKEIRAKQLNIVQGTTGSGKTLGAMLKLYHSICKNGEHGEYLRMTDLSQRLGRPGYVTQEKEAFRESLTKVPWIVIDDLGAEECSPRLAEEFFNLVDIWARRCITGIFITNENPRDFWPDRYGARTWSRIQGWSKGEILRTSDPDFRVHPEELSKYPKGSDA